MVIKKDISPEETSSSIFIPIFKTNGSKTLHEILNVIKIQKRRAIKIRI